MTRHDRCQKALDNVRDIYSENMVEEGRRRVDFEDCDTLQDLIDATEVIKPYRTLTGYACECGSRVEPKMHFCPDCGRELDWSVEE